MYDLMQNNSATMNHLEIADLVHSRDDDVKRSIDRLADRGVIALPPMAEVVSTSNNRSYIKKTYTFSGEKGKRDSLIVVAQLSPEFTGAIIDRWIELERQVRQPVTPAIPQSFAEALQLAANQALQIEQDAPKVNFYNTVAASDVTMTVSDVAKKIGLTAQKLNTKLVAIGAYDGRRLPKKIFAHGFIDSGYGVMKLTADGRERNLITQAGQIYILDLFGV